ncbi:carboxymuconolactone decarboxylase family protein [Oryzihumus leptocrescens]|uniref:AhpD family alkylhydroperoxidase n=1 Tax=Oryzihumus leptocrescens TaxID=297536 RepID=A0A542ZHG4_9MICO|nr:carboxymuconolactone decarboxylase family protein [Oryzihumus leptocrescens]TQL59739.1 AhpD family alkylhydroperoxidase [Oryzihumus leptocrescens]
MSTTQFPLHTIDSAPEAAQPAMSGVERRLGYLPAPVAMMATSPEALQAFLAASATFDRTSLTPVERETVILTVATRAECHVCVAMHTAALTRRRASGELIAQLRAGEPLTDPKLEALRRFTLAVMDSSGGVSASDQEAFLVAGYTRRNALEVVLGVGAYTMSTFANRLTGAPLDPQMEAYAWEPGA